MLIYYPQLTCIYHSFSVVRLCGHWVCHYVLFATTKKQQSRYSCHGLYFIPQIVSSHSEVVGICWPCPCCKMWRGQAKYKCVLGFKKHEMVSAEREAREHAVAVLHSVSQGTPAVMDGCHPLQCPPHFLRSHRWRSHLSGSQPPAVPGRKKACDPIHPRHP